VPARPRLLVPRGAVDALRHLSGLWGSDALVDAAFATQEYAAGDEIEVGDVRQLDNIIANIRSIQTVYDAYRVVGG